jgi:hypothetical protein
MKWNKKKKIAKKFIWNFFIFYIGNYYLIIEIKKRHEKEVEIILHNFYLEYTLLEYTFIVLNINIWNQNVMFLEREIIKRFPDILIDIIYFLFRI